MKKNIGILLLVILLAGCSNSTSSTHNAPTRESTNIYSETVLIGEHEEKTYPIAMNKAGTISGYITTASGRNIHMTINDPYGQQAYFNFGSGYWDFEIDTTSVGTYTLIIENNTTEDNIITFSVTKWE